MRYARHRGCESRRRVGWSAVHSAGVEVHLVSAEHLHKIKMPSAWEGIFLDRMISLRLTAEFRPLWLPTSPLWRRFEPRRTESAADGIHCACARGTFSAHRQPASH